MSQTLPVIQYNVILFFTLQMFDFENDLTKDKGLFTFYREQAQIDQKIAAEKKKQKQSIQNFTLKDIGKLNNRYDNNSKFDNRKSSQTDLNMTQRFITKRSFDQLNKDFIRKLSLKKQTSYDLAGKDFGSQVVVIKKSKSPKQKQNLKLQKLNLRYQMQDGYFIKQKTFDPLQESLFDYNQNKQKLQKSLDEFVPKRRKTKRNQSFNDKYHTHKNQLENDLLINKQTKQKQQGKIIAPRLQSIKRIDFKPQISEEQQKINIIQSHRSYHPVNKRIPPKVLASILKNQNHELIKHLRKQLEKQREEQNKSVLQNKNHSFIEYGSHDYQKSGLDVGRLNQKQLRLITILNKFHKKPFTKVFVN